MVKDCKVLLNNDAVTVVRFDGKDIQLPPIGRKANSVSVKYENGRYEVMDEKIVFKNNSDVDENIVVKNNNIVVKNNEEQPKARRHQKMKPVEVEE